MASYIANEAMGESMNQAVRLTASFRDPSGFVFSNNGNVYRQVNESYRETYDSLVDSGLYSSVMEKGLLVAHEEINDGSVTGFEECYRILRPLQIPFISYPYEWSFSQLKDAALLTLRLQSMALKHGFVLKDASAYNVQFVNGQAVFIDTLSFEPYWEGRPWKAYKQFCQHFIAPLALMAYTDIYLGKLLVTNIDGIPLPLASKLLPARTRLNYSLLAHIHLHARIQQYYADAAGQQTDKKGMARASKARLSRQGLDALLQSLAKAVNKLDWKLPKTEWGDYYDNTNYTDHASQQKRALVDRFLSAIPEDLTIIQDLGANTGEFSRVAAKHCKLVISQDIDPVAVERNYRQAIKNEPKNILPLIQNLFSPSPAIGWGNAERDSFLQRGRCSAVLALALIHHIAISNNVPLSEIARLFATLSRWLIIEFVPKSDSQVKRLLATREDIFPNYTEQGFELAFKEFYSIRIKQAVEDSDRTLYLLESRSSMINKKTASRE